MEQLKKKITYSIIRYSPDEIKGEVINVGLLFHDLVEKQVKVFMLDENCSKLKMLLENEAEFTTYKTNKEILEYYINASKDDISGVVGDLCIASYYDENFMEEMYKYYENQRIMLSKPNIAFTKNVEALFKTILKRYVGEKYILDIDQPITMTAKKYMKNIFKSNDKLNSRIESDKVIKPIKELDDLKVKIDFSFKNGKWNYMQTIPKPTNSNKNSEWFSKIELLLNCGVTNESKLHLLYKYSDFIEDKAAYNLLLYLKSKYKNIDIHNIDKQREVKDLCNYIETEGEILNKKAV